MFYCFTYLSTLYLVPHRWPLGVRRTVCELRWEEILKVKNFPNHFQAGLAVGETGDAGGN